MKINIDLSNLKNIDLHMHTTFSDGLDSPSDMLRAAARKGLKIIGISDHSYTFFDESYCIDRNNVDSYISELKLLKERCLSLKENPRFARALGSDDIQLFIGIEQDYYSTYPADGFDYVIGSVHYIRHADDKESVPQGCLKYGEHVYIPVDESAEILMSACETYYGGDIYKLIEDYYLIEADVVNHTNADIIGHFDLISKFNEKGEIFDPEDPRYINAWKKAAGELVKTGAIFEINTGAVSKGYRSLPYPSAEIISFIREKNGRFIYSSDAHQKENIAFGFEKIIPED